LLPAIAERNEEKFGCRTPGTGIPIISEQQSRALRPDYYFILPWHFREAFLKRESDFIERGGRLIFPLPALDIVPTGNKS
jgi:NDP-4-keto-2,6-dideoxyhexose 3-C-methyltransferase